ncbi:MAG: T9SS type A sorting domain-containing protein [Bacteroidetes bacterium]|nr:T9SS type A sorting domain-containing protein [Bacteroidota bacterium]
MKKLLLILAVVSFLFSDLAYSQGWVAQTSGVGAVSLSSVNFLSATTGLAVGSNGTIIKTTNGGTNWVTKTSLTANALTCVRFASATNAVAVGQFGIILLSTNAGETWTSQTTGTNLTHVNFPSALIGYAVGAAGTILKTTNGGANWTALTSGTTVNLTSAFFTTDLEGYVTGATGTIRKTTNGGTNWTALTSGVTGTLNSVSFVSTTLGWVCGAAGTMLNTLNGGTNWTTQSLGTVTANITSVNFLNPSTGWATGQQGRINYTATSGNTWSTQTSGTNSNLNGVSMVNTTTGWVVGDNGVVLKTTTGGLSAPTAPVLTTPANNSSNVSVTPTLGWNAVNGASSYKVQISTISNFGVITDSATVFTNSYSVPVGKLQNASAYFWRVSASNAVGTSAFSTVFNFSTTVTPPPTPTLVSPSNGANGQSLTPTLTWQAIAGATAFHIQISTISNFAVITDSGSVSGATTQYTVPAGKLGNGLTYFWRVSATNASGTGSFSSPWSFSTLLVGVNLISSEIPKEFKLFNNYPNPFNPTTKIRFNIPKSEFVSLKVYNSTGMLVSELLSGNFAAGSYETEFKASEFASGVYFYKIESASFSDTRRMILMK